MSPTTIRQHHFFTPTAPVEEMKEDPDADGHPGADPDTDDDQECAPPPPASQSHFAKFENFKPDDGAAFDDEFARLASSQDWVAGSQEYTRERTIAMREEMKRHFFSQQPATIKEEEGDEPELTDEDKLRGYQALCAEVGILPSDKMDECIKQLKSKLVNIVDLIDIRRTGKKVEVWPWERFQEFCEYTLEDEHRISIDEAKKNGGFLTALLQKIRTRGGPGSRRRRRGPRKDGSGSFGSRVVSGRVAKTEG
ncbi:hypothetical protein B0T26DRAFT_707636 [Lasiosphaeria miniovina]|uniref:Uncharacterized protein n=1 Tax=Lasiosphaeria miniovina TaxID=1954250 RepID=A0AA40DZ57_9PEZI|nr:uncharacterized protein B0T26DRAFT_707636 [Lasiosphaeria miniovina]KAK0716898.1 hypothetical protein B0T26DRAFT_707636 [Lasiosphaeria miniovina]